MEPALALSPIPANPTRVFKSRLSSNNELKAKAAAAADAALLPIPNPTGTPFLIFMTRPDFVLNFFVISLMTSPAEFFSGCSGMQSEL